MRLALIATVWFFVSLQSFGAAADFRPLDLSKFSTETNSTTLTAALPTGDRVLDNVPFKLAGPIQLTGMDAARFGEFWPDAARGVPVHQKARRIHLLVGAHHGQYEGAPLANVVLRFKSGETRALRLAFGVHTRNVIAPDENSPELADPNSRIAWQTNSGGVLRLHKTVFENPLPDEEIASVDFVSLFGRATPVIFAVTLQSGDVAPLLAPPKSRTLQRATALKDTAYRRELAVRVMNSSGQPLPNTTGTLSIADDAKTFFFGQFRADAAGQLLVAYPPQDAVAFHLRVNSAGLASSAVTLSALDSQPWPDSLEVRLEPGSAIGGRIVDAKDQPIEGASVIPFQITQLASNQFTRTDLYLANSGPDGRWSAHVPVQSVSNLNFEVTHPDFHSATLQLVSTDLLAGQARVGLQPHVRIAGRVINATGDPVVRATVILSDDDALRETRFTDGNGRFSFVVRDASDNNAHLLVTAPELAPTRQSVSLNRPSTAFTMKLDAGTPFSMQLTESGGRPVPDVKVSLFRWEGSQTLKWNTQTDADGRFRWEHAPSGSVSFRFEKTGHSLHTHSITLPSTTEAKLTYNRIMRVAGRVLDATTKQPIDNIRVRLRYEYSNGNGSGTTSTTGRRGSFSTTLSSGQNYTSVIVELNAPKYEQLEVTLQPPFIGTNEYLMRKARMIEATVFAPDGSPASGTDVVLLDPGNSAYMDEPGTLRRSSYGNVDVSSADRSGKLELTPRPNADFVIAAHPKLGFAQVAFTNFQKAGNKITLERWGHVKGELRVGDKLEPEHYASIHTHYVSDGTPGRSSSPLWIYYKMKPEADGSFHFEAVPPGERMVQLRYIFEARESGTMRLSHGVPVMVKPGETNNVLIGGTGRTVVGKVAITGAENIIIDGKRGEYQLRLLPGATGSEIPPPLRFPPNATAAERQQIIAAHQARVQEASRNRIRASRMLQRSYHVLFNDDNSFKIPNVPPGRYTLQLWIHDPRMSANSSRTLANLTETVTIPEGTTPHDLGTFQLQAR